MKKIILLSTYLFCVWNLKAQNEIAKANECYKNKDYQCAVDNYKISLKKASYAAKDKHAIEYRVGYGLMKLGQFTESLSYYRIAEKTQQNYGYGWWDIGSYFYRTKKFDSAIYYFNKTIVSNITKEEKQNALYDLADSYYNYKKYNDAISIFKKIETRENAFKVVDGAIGDSYYFNENYDSAITYYSKFLTFINEKDERFALVHTMIGKSYRKINNKEKALYYFNKVLALNPKATDTYWEIGIVYYNEKNYKLAIDNYIKAEAFYVNDTTQYLILNNNIIYCYNELKNYTELIKYLKIRVGYDKYNSDDYLRIMKVQYFNLKNSKDVEKVYQEFDRNKVNSTTKDYSNANEAKMLSIIANIYLVKKDTATALKYLKKGQQVVNYSYECNQLLGNIYWLKNQKDSSQKYYSKLYKTSYDTSLTSNKEIAGVYGRSVYFDFWKNGKKEYSISSDLKQALKFDSTQKEAIQLWPQIFSTYYSFEKIKIHDLIQNTLDKGIKLYNKDKEYVSDLYNSKAFLYSTEKRDTSLIRKNLDLAITTNPKNTSAWDNLLKYLSTYDNKTGFVRVEQLITILKKQKDNKTLSIAYIHKGDFYWRLDKKEEAKKAYTEALVWDAENKTAKERIKL